jgi:glycosyltransferase involved in cell wall biosynthesis
MPLVSVVLPVFNGARTLSEALESVLSQSFRDFELIVVDDGSEDGTPDVIEKYMRSDPRLKPIRITNSGIVVALNTGIAAAAGRYVARMDADDICEPARFDKQVAYLDRTPACVAVGSEMTLIDESGALLKSSHPKLRTSPLQKDRCRGFRHFPPSPPTVPHPSAMIRTEGLRRMGGYRTYFRSGAEDRDLWWRLMKEGEIHRIPERLLRYRVHQSSVSHRYREGMIVDAIVSDLSAISRYFGVVDGDLLETYQATQNGKATIEGYAARLGKRYPVWTLVKYRALMRGELTAGGWSTRAEVRRDAFRDVLKFPLSLPRWRLAAAATFG